MSETTVTALVPQGMVTIRGDLSDAAFANAISTVTDLTIPGQRAVTSNATQVLAWMSPDEILLLLPHAEAKAAAAKLTAAFSDLFAMAVDVSDARAVFEIKGSGAREALAKLAPVDLAPGHFGPGEMRRTRLAQVPAAFWMTGEDSFRLICFRSVAVYVEGLLKNAAATPPVGHFA